MPNRNIAIVGASGSIGSAFAEHYAQQQNVNLQLFSRSLPDITGDNINVYELDYGDEASVQQAACAGAQVGAYDLVIVATGMLHDETMQPEKSLRDLDAAKLQKIFFVNSVVPALLAKYFLPNMKRRQRNVFAVLSARVGSISDNRLGGWYGYRASKAALNMLIKTASIEMARLNNQGVVVGLHPGTVDSPLSKPFQRNVAKQQLFQPADAARRLADVINGLTQSDSGNVLAWDGSTVAC